MTTHLDPEAIPRAAGRTWQDLLDADSRPVPASFRDEAPYLSTMDDIPVDRYLSREYHELEKERLWSRVWQMACREEHLPEIGSYIVYDICDASYLVVRTAVDEIKAYPNACLHRGRALKSFDSRCSEFRCPYHGYTWRLDGSLKHVPADWDFPQLAERPEDFRLPDVRVGTWGGFVFINPNPDCEPLADFLGILPAHFERWDYEHRYVAAHASRTFNCNWKIAQEAFMEGYHVNATHPQGVIYSGDPQSQIDVWGNVGRYVGLKGVSSPLLNWEPSDEDMLRAALDVREGEEMPVPYEDGMTVRSVLSATGRERFRPSFGDRVDDLCDAEFLDALVYHVFPNFAPWGALSRVVYRFRPNGDRHDSCIMEVMYVAPFQGERPPPAEVVHLGPNDPWTDAPALEKLAQVLEQDAYNMELVQKGLKMLRRGGVAVSRYQEALVRWRHDLLEDHLRRPPVRP